MEAAGQVELAEQQPEEEEEEAEKDEEVQADRTTGSPSYPPKRRIADCSGLRIAAGCGLQRIADC
eukprot:15483720-Alexandrium_andersonii.AAC.1